MRQGDLHPGRRQAKEFAERWSWQETETDWRRLLERKDIDLIDICVPTRCTVTLPSPASGRQDGGHGKAARAERPAGKEMVDAAAKSGKKTMIWFNRDASRLLPWQSR